MPAHDRIRLDAECPAPGDEQVLAMSGHQPCRYLTERTFVESDARRFGCASCPRIGSYWPGCAGRGYRPPSSRNWRSIGP